MESQSKIKQDIKALLYLCISLILIIGLLLYFDNPTTVNTIVANVNTTVVLNIPGTNYTCSQSIFSNGYWYCDIDNITRG